MLANQPGRPALDCLFRPRSVAVIGATERQGSVGRAVISNLKRNSFGGTLYPIHPTHSAVLELPCFPSITDVPAPVDLAVIVTPAATVPGIVRECADAGVASAIVITAGFRETGSGGAELERQILEEARRTGMRILGPNCVGLMCPGSGLNATFAASMARPGHLGLISQSGAICTAILDWSMRENVGFSAFVSVGSMVDIEWGDLIQYLGDDPATRSIVMYMESVPDARKFLSAAREIALTKPIIVLKTGRTEAASKAAASHTGALTGSDDVLEAAFRRCGVLRVNTIAELFNLSEALDKQPRPAGPHLSIISNAGGAAVLATDALLGQGGALAQLSPATIESLNAVLPAHWSHQNPVDILGDASPERYAQAIEIVSQDPASDGVLVVLAPQAMTDPSAVAEKVVPYAAIPGKPLLASWMGGANVAPGEALLNQARIPTFAYPDSAASVFQSMWRYSANLNALYETPQDFEAEDPGAAAHAAARSNISEVVAKARSQGRTLLTEVESKGVLAAYGIPTVETRIATTAEEAARAAATIGYPVVLKLHSGTITHKTDVGGVRLNLADELSVRDAYEQIRQKVPASDFLGVTVQPMVRLDGYELILGSNVDAQFGPVLLFGGGGQLVEVYKDRALGLPPLNTTLARRLMERTKVFAALQGVRGRAPVDLAALERLLVRFSYLVLEQRWIREIDINPLLASPDRLLALDARVILQGPGATAPEPSIRPYPSQYASTWTMRDGTDVWIRPIRPEDEPRMVEFHQKLSERSVYLRYFQLMTLSDRVAHDRLRRICFVDYDREIALVAEHDHEILAAGRLRKNPSGNSARLSLLITDEHQGLGLGTEMWRQMIAIARQEKIERVTASTLAENHRMLEICSQLGFERVETRDEVVQLELHLG